MLSEGVAPVRALNLTEEVYDKPQTVDELKTWAKVLIAVAAALTGILVGSIIVRLCTRAN